MNKENKPCPFCGSDELYVEDEHPFWAGCDHCGAQGPSASTPYEAWEKWNKRSGEDDTMSILQEQ